MGNVRMRGEKGEERWGGKEGKGLVYIHVRNREKYPGGGCECNDADYWVTGM